MIKKLLMITMMMFISIGLFAKKPTLGILPFEIKTNKVSKISDHMYKYLRKQVKELVSDKYTITPAPSMDLEEMYMMLACDGPDAYCMGSISKMMKSRYLIYGTVSAHRDKYELVLRLFDSKNPKKIKKGRLIGDLVSVDAMNKNINNALKAMFKIKDKPKQQVKPKEYELLSIKTGEISSEVFIDNKSVGKTPLVLTTKNLKEGKHDVLIKKKGYEPVKKTVTLTKKKTEVIDLKLAKVVIPAMKDKKDKKDKNMVAVVDSKKTTKKADTLDLSKTTHTDQNQDKWYKKWWVWTAAGAVVLTTVVTIVLVSGDDGGSTPNNNVVISF